MIEKIEKFIKTKALLDKGSRLLAAVSGGADSVAMLFALNHLGYECVVAHLNHNLRGHASDCDQRFVVELAHKLGLEILLASEDVTGYANKKKISIETAGRQLRIKTLAQMAQKNHCAAVATAHHTNDNVETVLHRILRGTAFRGLAGIPCENILQGVRFVRPLLDVSRDEIEKYLTEKGIQWRDDHTNAEVDFTRNWIRHRLLPDLQNSSNGNIFEKIRNLTISCSRLQHKLDHTADQMFKQLAQINSDHLRLNLAAFNNTAILVRCELIRIAIDHLGIGQRDISFENYNDIINLASRTGKRSTVNLPRGYKAEIIGDSLLIGTAEKKQPEPVKLNIDRVTHFETFKITARILDASNNDLEKFVSKKDNSIEWFDADQIDGQLHIRPIKNGDKFTAIGQNTQRKIGDYTKDKTLPVIADKNNILWILNHRRSKWAMVTKKTTSILELKITGN